VISRHNYNKLKKNPDRTKPLVTADAISIFPKCSLPVQSDVVKLNKKHLKALQVIAFWWVTFIIQGRCC